MRIRTALIWCLPTLLFFQPQEAWSFDKKALLIGIGEYEHPRFAAQPLQASFGLELIARTLEDRGFGEKDISMISDRQAGFKDIERAVFALTESLESGMQVVLYLYGHGVHILDDNGDEEDGLDEALVPYDGQWSSPEDHRHLIRDDLLGAWVDALRDKVGPEGFVLVLFDACHSGSGLRASGNHQANWSRRGIHDVTPLARKAPMAVLYSSLPHQPSMEVRVEAGKRCALMTWSFAKAMGASAPGSSWRSVFERTAAYMSSRTRKQVPSWEGETDRLVFGEALGIPPRYFRIIGLIDSQTVLIDGGRFHGLSAGNTLHLYPADTRDTQSLTPLAQGTVSAYCGIIESMVRIDKALSDEELDALWVFPGSDVATIHPVRIHFSGSGQDFRKDLALSTMDIPGLLWSDSLEARLHLSKDDDFLRITDRERGSETKWSCKRQKDGDLIRVLHEWIIRWQMAQFLVSWESRDENLPIALLAGKEESELRSLADQNGWSLRQNEDVLHLKIRNTGTKPIYYTILDIDPEDMVRVLIPAQGRLPEEYRVLPGSESRTHRIRFDKTGRQVLKLLASAVPVHLEPSLRTRALSGMRGKDAAAWNDMHTLSKVLTPWTTGFFHTETLELHIE